MATEDWIRELKSERPADRWRAARQLANAPRTQRQKALTALREALDDDHPFVRWQAGRALAAHRSEGVAVLLSTLKEASPRCQAAAADALAYADRVNPEPLLQALTSPNATVRQSAAEALGHLSYRPALPRFITLLTDESPWVRRAAARALGHVGDASAVGPLSRRLTDESPLVRRSAAYALGALRARPAVSALIRALEDSDPLVRRNAAWALGRIGDPTALPRLRVLLSDPAFDGEVAREAEAAIRAIERPPWQRLPDLVRNRLALRPGSAR